MASRKGVIVLVINAHWRRETLGQLLGRLNAASQDRTSTIQDNGELGTGKQLRRCCDGCPTSRGALKSDALWQLHIDNFAPHVPRNVDLRWRAASQRLFDDTVQDLWDARRVSNLLLVAHAVLEHGHLLHLLETSLTNGLICCLGRHQQQRRVIPVGCLHWRHKVGDAWAVLGNHHGHPACHPAEAIGHHTRVVLMGAIPELHASSGEQV
mmetsp:Transcript_37958/g.101130  ORF Transcript_37958/g.101130 Transcript_37958/m.101130 type:complete len:210 (+) Transcript_37958:260-889(+)